jgi:hypothetical protein
MHYTYFKYELFVRLYFIEHGANSLKCTKILSQCHLFLSFLPGPLLPFKDKFMDDYDEI